MFSALRSKDRPLRLRAGDGGINRAARRSLDEMPANILVVEHDPRLRASLAAPLQRAGYEARCVASLAEAETALAGGEADALLIERRLPGESALSFVSRLRARPATRHLAIVVLSEGAHEDDRVLALEAGADHYLELPISEKEFAARIAAARACRAYRGRLCIAASTGARAVRARGPNPYRARGRLHLRRSPQAIDA